MKMFFAYLVILIIINFQIIFVNSENDLDSVYGKVIFTTVVFRHGDRTPIGTYPLDPYRNYTWKHGYGQLTEKGKRDLYGLGVWLKNRYINLTGDEYHPSQVVMQSSNVIRTVQSGLSVFAGYFPPKTSDAFYNFSWQPIPVQTIPVEEDNLILMTKSCTAYTRELHRLGSTPGFSSLFLKNQHLITYAEKNAGIKFPEFSTMAILRHFILLYDILHVQEINGLKLPDWTKTIYPEPLRSLANEAFLRAVQTHKLKKLLVGPFLNSLRTDLINKRNYSSDLTMHLYSGHDSTIASIMIALDIYNNILPPYGATLLFELRKTETQLNLLVLYKNSTNAPYLMKIPSSGGNTLNQFLDAISLLIPKNWKKACK